MDKLTPYCMRLEISDVKNFIDVHDISLGKVVRLLLRFSIAEPKNFEKFYTELAEKYDN
ncbi:MAG: hypothetical protein ACI4VW_08675 [Acutalibacteraceae bacterium]